MGQQQDLIPYFNAKAAAVVEQAAASRGLEHGPRSGPRRGARIEGDQIRGYFPGGPAPRALGILEKGIRAGYLERTSADRFLAKDSLEGTRTLARAVDAHNGDTY